MKTMLWRTRVCVGSANSLVTRLPIIIGKVSLAFIPEFWSLRSITDEISFANHTLAKTTSDG